MLNHTDTEVHRSRMVASGKRNVCAGRSMHASLDGKGRGMTEVRKGLYRRFLSVCKAVYWLFNATMSPETRPRGGWHAGTWSPAVDLYETEDALILKAELAGFSKTDVHVEFRDRVLLLKGSRPRQRGVAAEQYHCREWASGAFQRCFLLPALVDRENVSTSYQDGVFQLRLAKVETLNPRYDQHRVTSQSH